VDAIAREHLHGVQERLGRLRSMERELKRMVRECGGGKVAEDFRDNVMAALMELKSICR
jgi:hypothetical protein